MLRAANALIAQQPARTSRRRCGASRPTASASACWECRDDEHEAEKVAAEIAVPARRSTGAPWSDFCDPVPRQPSSRARWRRRCSWLRVPYHLTGGTAFLDRGEVKDALAWLRLLANPDDDAAFLRAVQSPKREVGATTLAKLGELAQQAHLPLSRAAESVGLLKQLPPRAGERAAAASPTSCAACAATPRACRRPNWCARLNERSGLLAMLRAQCKDEATFQRRRGNLDELADWFDGPAQAAGTGRTRRAARAAVATPTRATPATRCG